VQKWLGHAQLTTTGIYADAMGEGSRASRRGCGEATKATDAIGFRKMGVYGEFNRSFDMA
jgi:hypothetical protein